MKMQIDWFRVGVILVLTTAVVWVSILLGRSPIGFAFGGEARLTWEAPTTNCDGSPLTNLARYDLTWGQKRVELPTDPLAHTVSNLTPGVWWFSLSAVNTEGKRSDVTVAERTIAPEEFVTKTPSVYTFFRAEGKVIVTPTLHTVPIGTQCDASQSVNGKYVIPRSAVIWSGNARLVAVLGDCG